MQTKNQQSQTLYFICVLCDFLEVELIVIEKMTFYFSKFLLDCLVWLYKTSWIPTTYLADSWGGGGVEFPIRFLLSSTLKSCECIFFVVVSLSNMYGVPVALVTDLAQHVFSSFF